ncbi:UNVERIFIED_CONTAM: Dirigent protein 11 [Sesamum radiatum]|uniref:Dirigent protein n=1 Tax=Sesamum radiatum TaxID=300843 RepID=A0AAW2S385_SESRA
MFKFRALKFLHISHLLQSPFRSQSSWISLTLHRNAEAPAYSCVDVWFTADEHTPRVTRRIRIESLPRKGTGKQAPFLCPRSGGGENPTVWKVAQSNLTDVLPSAFGLVSVVDNLVTSGPEIESREVGRIQGLIGLADFHEKALVMLLNVVFTEGEYKGSTLSILGRNPLDDEVREVPVVGGTGGFRMARGYAVTTTYAVDKAHTHGVIEYNVVVAHYDDDAMKVG